MKTAKQITSLIAVGAVALAISAAPAVRADAPKHHSVPAKSPTVLRVKHVNGKPTLVPTRKPAKPIKVPAVKTPDTPGVTPVAPAAGQGGPSDTRPLGMPNGVGGTGVPGPGTDH